MNSAGTVGGNNNFTVFSQKEFSDPSSNKKLTGNLTQDGGAVHNSFNHYRPEIEHEGLKAHKDIGFVTVLFINQLGLEGQLNGQWEQVPPLEGHFIVNFGRCLELATGNRDLVHAISHRVQHVAEERISFGIFLDGDMKQPLYSYSGGEDCHKQYVTAEAYMKKCFDEVYTG